MNYLSSSHYHLHALSILRTRFFPNLIKWVVLEVVFTLSTLSILLVPLIPIAYTSAIIQLLDTGEINYKHIFKSLNMTSDRYLNVWLISSLLIVIILSGYALFIIPGFIFTLSFAPVFYLLTSKKTISISSVLGNSVIAMHGNKVKLLKIILLGIGYALLAILGIGLLVSILELVAFLTYNIDFLYYFFVVIEGIVLFVSLIFIPLLVTLELSLAITHFMKDTIESTYFIDEI